MSNKLLNCLIAGALATTLALASPALAFKGGGGGGMRGGMGGGMGGMHAMGGGGCVAWVAGCTSAAGAEAHGSAAGVSRLRRLRVLHSRLAFQAPHSLAGAPSSIIASSIIASIVLRSLARPSPSPPTTAAGAEYGRHMDCSGSTSATTTATGDIAEFVVMVATRPEGGDRHALLRAALRNPRRRYKLASDNVGCSSSDFAKVNAASGWSFGETRP